MDSLSRFFAFALLMLVVAFGIACGASEEDSETFMLMAGGEGASFSEESFDSDDSADFVSSAQPPTTASSDQTTTTSADDGRGSDAGELETGFPPVAAQDRLIVRIVNMTIEVDDVPRRIEDVSGIALQRGGWVVNEQRSSRHVGHISIRVPSAQLDDAVRAISNLGLDVLSLISSSQDVTEEYFDVQSRITNLNVTLDALRELLKQGRRARRHP